MTRPPQFWQIYSSRSSMRGRKSAIPGRGSYPVQEDSPGIDSRLRPRSCVSYGFGVRTRCRYCWGENSVGFRRRYSPDLIPSWLNRRMTSGIAILNFRPTQCAILQNREYSSLPNWVPALLVYWEYRHHPPMSLFSARIVVATESWWLAETRARSIVDLIWSMASLGMLTFVFIPLCPFSRGIQTPRNLNPSLICVIRVFSLDSSRRRVDLRKEYHSSRSASA